MLLTIGMPSYDNFADVWFTVQALRMYHDMTDCEILVVDNKGDARLAEWVKGWGAGLVRYELYTETNGTAPAKQSVFDNARGDWVVCVDSHILLAPGAVARVKDWIRANPENDDLIHGPMVYDALNSYTDRMLPVWRGQMWGIWGPVQKVLPPEPYEIEMHGGGVFGARRESWLGFNPSFKGFGGEEGYIHQKYRQAGRRVLCLPWLVWCHKFNRSQVPYPLLQRDKIRNYLIGFDELGLDIGPIKEHFGPAAVERVEREIWQS